MIIICYNEIMNQITSHNQTTAKKQPLHPLSSSNCYSSGGRQYEKVDFV